MRGFKGKVLQRADWIIVFSKYLWNPATSKLQTWQAFFHIRWGIYLLVLRCQIFGCHSNFAILLLQIFILILCTFRNIHHVSSRSYAGKHLPYCVMALLLKCEYYCLDYFSTNTSQKNTLHQKDEWLHNFVPWVKIYCRRQFNVHIKIPIN